MSVDKSRNILPFDASIPISAPPSLKQTFNNTQNWTVPSGVNGIWVHLVGGGGGGTARINSNSLNGTGGAGGNATIGFTPVTPGETIGITIGAGGTGGVVQTNDTGNQLGNAGGDTFVNTSGTSWGAGGAMKAGNSNPTNGQTSGTRGGLKWGVTRQQIKFGSKNQSPRLLQTFWMQGIEGCWGGGTNGTINYNGSSNNAILGSSATYAGASGGFGSTNATNLPSTGGNSNMYGFNGGAGGNNIGGGGGGGAGIAGNGGNASGNNGGTGGAGGGGGGGQGATATVNTGGGGAGGAGCVKIYY